MPFEKRVLMAIHGPERGDVTGGWRRVHKEECGLLTRQNWNDQVAEDTMGRAYSMDGIEEEWVKVLVGEPEGKTQ
jgi:hypothetical protein